jgi:hypothetical protein
MGAEALYGFSPADAMTLWRELGVSGARDELLLQALAGEVASFRPAPADFAA